MVKCRVGRREGIVVNEIMASTGEGLTSFAGCALDVKVNFKKVKIERTSILGFKTD